VSTQIEVRDVRERLAFAEKRLHELLALNGGNLPGADGSERQQLLQEFFFHLVGTTEVLAQLVNERRGVNMDPERVSIHKVVQRLSSDDPVRSQLSSLYAQTRGNPLPENPYSDEGYIFRILNYRHQVTHRRRNPFLFRVGSSPPASFLLDPRVPDQNPTASDRSAQEEMEYMLDLVRTKCEEVLSLL
jgi:hypothetical protein